MDKKLETEGELHRKFLREEKKKDILAKKARKKQPKSKSSVLG